MASLRILAALLFLLCVPGLPVARAQNEDTTRHLWDTAFIGENKKQTSARKPPAQRRYRIATPSIPAAGVAPDTVIGLTIWRLRPVRSAEVGERILAHEAAGPIELIPERVSADAKLAEGDRVRLSFEAAGTGHLYVIDREQYADGTLGEPYLIFPTKRTRGGINEVRPGRVVEVPAQDDQPPYFTLKPSRPDQVSEMITVLVTPNPLEGLQIGESAIKLQARQVAEWEKSWVVVAGRLEMENGEGRIWTKAEKAAGADGTRSLLQNDPPPQTLYYNPDAKSGAPVLVNVQLRYGRGASPQRRKSSSP